jgi:hypothetical protein
MWYTSLLNELNLTVGSLVIMFLSMFVVEAGRLIARSRSSKNRTPLSWKVWASDWVNWLTVVATIATGVICISIRDGIAEFGGMSVSNQERFDLFFAAVVGSGGQGLWKIVLKAGAMLRGDSK